MRGRCAGSWALLEPRNLAAARASRGTAPNLLILAMPLIGVLSQRHVGGFRLSHLAISKPPASLVLPSNLLLVCKATGRDSR